MPHASGGAAARLSSREPPPPRRREDERSGAGRVRHQIVAGHGYLLRLVRVADHEEPGALVAPPPDELDPGRRGHRCGHPSGVEQVADQRGELLRLGQVAQIPHGDQYEAWHLVADVLAERVRWTDVDCDAPSDTASGAEQDHARVSGRTDEEPRREGEDQCSAARAPQPGQVDTSAKPNQGCDQEDLLQAFSHGEDTARQETGARHGNCGKEPHDKQWDDRRPPLSSLGARCSGATSGEGDACDQGGEENDATQLDHHCGGQRPVDAVGCGHGLADIMDARADPTTEVAWVEPKGSPKGGEQHDGNTAAQSDKRDRHCGVILVRAGDLGHRGAADAPQMEKPVAISNERADEMPSNRPAASCHRT
jgi:hypothetical protein